MAQWEMGKMEFECLNMYEYDGKVIVVITVSEVDFKFKSTSQNQL